MSLALHGMEGVAVGVGHLGLYKHYTLLLPERFCLMFGSGMSHFNGLLNVGGLYITPQFKRNVHL